MLFASILDGRSAESHSCCSYTAGGFPGIQVQNGHKECRGNLAKINCASRIDDAAHPDADRIFFLLADSNEANLKYMNL